MSHHHLPNLKEILSSTSTPKLLSDDDSGPSSPTGEQMDIDPEMTPEGYCVECKDQQAALNCSDCQEDFCEVCFNMIHRTGSRAKHSITQLNPALLPPRESSPAVTTSKNASPMPEAAQEVEAHLPEPHQVDVDFNSQSGLATPNGIPFSTWMIERTKYIPLRLTHLERRKLRLLESALHVSEYTDKIDILHSGSKHQRIVQQIKNTCAILSGLMVACDYKKGQELFSTREFHENEAFFQGIFEVGRRYKIMNPERMRSTYGKLMYLLQDSQIPHVLDSLQFTCVQPIQTVYSFLKGKGGLELLNHEYLALATREIIPEGKTRSQIQGEIKQKEKAIKFLSNRFCSRELSVEDIETCLYSIGDNHSYLRTNRDPCDHMLEFLTSLFSPDHIESPEFSLGISMGRQGARLSHDHRTQFYYVQQTLTLWREILHDMFQLWYLADSDLLNPNQPYRLRDTGQGLNRMQPCAQISKLIHQILHRAQQRAGHWVGSSVVHLADSNVPNALMFIDKYNQVSRILNPIVLVINYLDKLENRKHKLTEGDSGVVEYLQQQFGGVLNVKKLILADFFRGAFDGSGADNYFQAGSCIDGRLTSAWNWCSLIEKKPFYNVFLLAGFIGFDGENF